MAEKKNSSLFQPGRPSDWVERNGGLVVAFSFWIATLAVLANSAITIIRPPEKEQELRFVLEPIELPKPPPPEPKPENLVPEEVAATAAQVRSALVEEIVEKPVEQPPQHAPQSLEEWAPSTEADFQTMQEIAAEIAEYRDRLDHTSNLMKAEINRMAIESIGRDFLVNSDGGKQGIIRTIEIDGFPDDLVARVLRRYGITITNRELTGQETANCVGCDEVPFLNAASMNGTAFTNSDVGPGMYEVFQLSAKSVAMMMSLELDGLQRRGYEPGDARIRKVVFGIVKDFEDEYALGVVDMEVERVR